MAVEESYMEEDDKPLALLKQEQYTEVNLIEMVMSF